MSTTADLAFDEATLERFADLAVGFAANVQPGQIVAIGAEIGKEEMVRALAASAYRHGAKFVDPLYFDMHVKRARILHAEEDTLDFVPSLVRRADARARPPALRAHRASPARRRPGCSTTSTRARAGRDQLPVRQGDRRRSSTSATTNWTIVPFPTAAWAHQVHPGPRPTRRAAASASRSLHVCRLDEDDPVAAWRSARTCSSAPPSA